ncbi:MAG: glyoxalase [Acidobacteria bacterium]|nr:MAG: glyoxalase [Acidobacteriota bacterium]
MTRTTTSLVVLVAATAFAQQQAPGRPKITGIDHVAFYTTDPVANARLYNSVLGIPPTIFPTEPGQSQGFQIGRQSVVYTPAPDQKSNDRMDHVAFRTDDCEALRSYLRTMGVAVPNSIDKVGDARLGFKMKDPEGHVIEFVQLQPVPPGGVTASMVGGLDPVSRCLIHTGFIVHDRAAEDHFYKDILGFHLYWYGGMKPDRTDWVAMQVPDGTDWLEYMLNQPMNPDLRLTGVMNHISLGVKDMKAAQARLESRGWKPHGDEHSQMGKDGKWQLNLFDPDQTRIELMEFTPAEKPCCSEFQGQHPTEQ